LRIDHKVIVDLIKKDTKVLDLGCGDGELLSILINKKNCHGTGIEINEKAIYKCMEKGLSVSHGDIDTGLMDYSDKRFHYVILNESLQEVLNLNKVIIESLRVGEQVIVGVPNFCHIKARCQIFFQGKVPVTKNLPHQWYNTPNVRFFSLKDFEFFCSANNIKIFKKITVGTTRIVNFMPNMFSMFGIYLLKR